MKHNTKTKVAMLVGGALVGLASLIPLATYAAPGTCVEYGNGGTGTNCIKAAGNATVTAVINPFVTLDVAIPEEAKGDSGAILTTAIAATVSSNKNYQILIKTATSETGMTSAETSDKIPANANVGLNTNAWAIKAINSDGTEGAYTEMSATDQVMYESTTGAVSEVETVFPVGISTGPSIAAGTYSINLTVTAATI